MTYNFSIQSNIMQYNIIQYNIMQFNAIQYNRVQIVTIMIIISYKLQLRGESSRIQHERCILEYSKQYQIPDRKSEQKWTSKKWIQWSPKVSIAQRYQPRWQKKDKGKS